MEKTNKNFFPMGKFLLDFSIMTFHSYRFIGLNLPEYWHENLEVGFVSLCRFIRIILFYGFIRRVLLV